MGFFNDLKGTVADTGKSISNKAKQTTDTAKLKNQVKNNEKSIDNLIFQIGSRFLERCTEEIDPDYADLITEIRRLQDENAALSSAIEANTAPAGSKQCANCGKYNAPEAKFCISCGAELKAPEPVAEAAPAPSKFCSYCGCANSPEAAFCIGCGKPFEAAAAPEAGEPAAEEPQE